jgi:GTPase Era involved in 16S rRNA processing
MEGEEEYQPKRRAAVTEKLFLLVGPTRSGKSTFINTVLGEVLAVEGQNRSARSTTREI